jgi:maleate isomerase/arylmalonate decarboxylase
MAVTNDHYRPYGTRAKLGIIVPPTNTVNEAEWARMMPEGVTMHAMRMALHADTASEAGKRKLYDDIRAATREVAKAHVDVVVYACTAGSMVQPLDSLSDFMRDVAGVPAVATAPALVYAARALGLQRIALATPYHDALNDHEVHFLADNGIEAVSLKGLGIGAGGPHEYINIARTPKERVYEHCRSVDVPQAQGMIISCTDFATLEALPRLEREIGKPVISSNLATFWLALRSAGVRDRIKGFGRLLEER